MVGAPASGDVMELQIKVNGEGVLENPHFFVKFHFPGEISFPS